MAIPHKFIGHGQTAHSLTCSKCGRPCAAVHHDGKGSCCFDFEQERKRAIYIPKKKTEDQKAAMRERSRARYRKLRAKSKKEKGADT